MTEKKAYAVPREVRRGRWHLGQVPVQTEVDDELRFHIEMQTRRFVDAGLPEHEARRAALERFGDLTEARAECLAIGHSMEASMRRVEIRQEVGQDAAYAWRHLRRNPGFTAVALLTIALGIGANTAIFSVVQSVLLRPLPYREAERVVGVWNQNGGARPGDWAMSAPEFADIAEQTRTFSGVSAIRTQRAALTGSCGVASCEPESVTGFVVSPNFFQVLGASPRHGRAFRDSDGRDGSEPVAVLSHFLWMRRYGGDSAIIGRLIGVNGVARTVVGILPSEVRFPDAPFGWVRDRAEVWVPYSWEQQRGGSRGNQILVSIARLKPGVSLAAARADLDVISARFRQQFPDRYTRGAPWQLAAVPLRDQMVGDARLSLSILAVAVGLVLLIACANVANLLLARGAARRTELAVRAALGAGPGRITRQLLTESLLLAVAGGLLGVLLAWWGVRLVLVIDPAHLPRLDSVGINGTVLGYALAVSVFTGLLFGIAPALQQRRADPQDALQSAGRGTGGAIRGRLRYTLVAAEMAMALIVLVGAALLVRSLLALERVPLGFDGNGVQVMHLSLPRLRYDSAYKLTAFARDLTARLAALPGVTHATAVYPLPLSGQGWSGSFDVEGLTVAANEQDPHAEYAVAMPGYFRALGIAMRAGRDFTPDDKAGTPRVVIVDEFLARKYWPNESAVGKRINANGPAGRWEVVVGVVGHVHNAGPQSEGEPQIYLPYLQNPQGPLFPVVKAEKGAVISPAILRAQVRSIDAELPVTTPGPMGAVIERAFARERFNTVLLSVFGLVALALAAIGLYGVMSFLVAQRSHEIGVRLALGGRPADVIRLVLMQGLAITGAGLVIGLLATLAATRALSTLVFGLATTDAVTYGGVSLLLLGVAAAACYLPARRATRVDPIAAMRAPA